MWSIITSIVDLRTALLVTALILLLKFILDKCGPDPHFREIDSQIPGPYRWPIIGNSLSFIIAGKNGQAELQSKLIKKYGRIYRMWVGNYFVVQLSHPDDLEAVYTNSKLLGKGRITWPFNNCFGNGLFTVLSVPIWKKNRKRLQPFFTKDVIKDLSPQMNRSIYKVLDVLEKYVDGPEVEICDIFNLLSFDFITQTVYDFEISQDKELVTEFDTTVASTLDYLNMQVFFPFLTKSVFRFLWDKLYVMKKREYFMNFSRKIISKKLKALQNGTYNSDEGRFSSEMFLSTYNNTDEISMLEEVITIIIAGGETTMRTITFCLFMLAMHPEIQAKAYEEIQEIFGDDTRQADIYDCDRLTYLGQIIKETLRRFTLLPIGFREAEEEVKIGPYTFPAKTQFMINVSGIHFDPKLYPNPYEFNPDNFTPEAIEKRHKYSFFPFGAGARNCMGKNLAELELPLALIAILRKFSVRTTKTMNDINLTAGVVMRNEGGIWLSFKHRNPK